MCFNQVILVSLIMTNKCTYLLYRTECLPDDRCLRFSAIKYLHMHDSRVLWKTVLRFIVKIESSSQDRKYFHNSKAHHIKQRVVQVLLIVACDVWHEVCFEVINNIIYIY